MAQARGAAHQRPHPARARRRLRASTSARHASCDVGPRDGLQNEAEVLDAGRAGRARQPARRRAACRGSRRSASSATTACRRWPAPRRSSPGSSGATAPSTRGLVPERAGATSGFARRGSTASTCTLAATETFNQRNGNASLDEAIARVERDPRARRERARDGRRSASPSAARSRAAVDPGRVAELARAASTARRGRPRGHDRRRGARARSRAASSASRRRATRLPRPQHAQHRLRERASPRSRRARRCSTRRSAGSAAARTRRARRGNVATEDLVYLLEREGDRDRRRPRRADRDLDLAGRRLRPHASRARSTGRGDLRRRVVGERARRRGRSPASPVCQFETETRIALRPSQVVPLSQTRPLSCTRGEHLVGALVATRSGRAPG